MQQGERLVQSVPARLCVIGTRHFDSCNTDRSDLSNDAYSYEYDGADGAKRLRLHERSEIHA